MTLQDLCRCAAIALGCAGSVAAVAQPAPLWNGTQLSPDWTTVGLPASKGVPMPQFEPLSVDGQAALRIKSSAAYGHVLWATTGPWNQTLQWQWRVDQALTSADLRTRTGDDTAVRVCALFDVPLSELPFGQRVQMQLARSISGQALPSATVCYVWDDGADTGAHITNAYSERVRYWVLRGRGSATGAWYSETRDLASDYLALFGSRAQGAPPLIGLSVGADSDNTQGQSLAWVRALQAAPQPRP